MSIFIVTLFCYFVFNLSGCIVYQIFNLYHLHKYFFAIKKNHDVNIIFRLDKSMFVGLCSKSQGYFNTF